MTPVNRLLCSASCLLCWASLPAEAADTTLSISEVRTEPVTETLQWDLKLERAPSGYGIGLSGAALEGGGMLRVLDAQGKVLESMPLEGRTFVNSKMLDAPEQETALKVELELHGFKGAFKIMAGPMPDRNAFFPLLLSGPLMLLIAAAALFYWLRRYHPGWRYFAAGAAVWTVGVGLKFLWAVLLNSPTLMGLEHALSHRAYVAGGSLYIGLLTGVFEIGVTLAAALIWRKLTVTGGRAGAVGVGAGAFEAALLGLAAFANPLVLLVIANPAVDAMKLSYAELMINTPLIWLCGPAERTLAIACHLGSRVMVCYCVAARRWRFFWYAFLLMTGLDTIAGYVHLSGRINTTNMWWVEAALLPFAIIGLCATSWCIGRWPAPENAPAS